MDKLKNLLVVLPEVQKALQGGGPVVALETATLCHGMPYPQNVEAALQAEEIVRQNGATPAFIALVGGRLRVGLAPQDTEYLGKKGPAVQKASRRDLPVLVARGQDGAATVAAAMILSALVGIRVFSTGFLGGVHRGSEAIPDISADLEELARTSAIVVCAGLGPVFSPAATLEYLETRGVPVLGYKTEELPGFYSRKSGCPANYRVNSPAEIAESFAAKEALGLGGGLLAANPVDEKYALDEGFVARATEEALQEATRLKVRGGALTPFLLGRLHEITGGKSLATGMQLLYGNARLAAAIAAELSRL